MKVFVDTSALYAVLTAEDAQHELATACFEQLRLAEAELITTNYIVLECVSLVQRRHGFASAKDVLTKTAGLLDVLWIGPQEHEQAVALWSKAGQRKLSLVDCISFVVMRERGIRKAAAFDAHFAEAGFETLPRADRVSERPGTYRAGRRTKTHG